MYPVDLRLVVVGAELLIRCLLLVCITCTPRNSANLSIIHLLVVLDHIFVNFLSISINLLILLEHLVTIGISFIIQLVHRCLVVPILVRLEIATVGLGRAEIVFIT